MELRGREKLEVSEVDVGSLEAVNQSGDKSGSRSSCVSGEDNSCFRVRFDLLRLDEAIVDFDKGFVRRSVGKVGRVGFPRSLIMSDVMRAVDVVVGRTSSISPCDDM